MRDFICTNHDCPNCTSLGHCIFPARSTCGQMCPQTRWTDKLSLDGEGNVRDFDGNIVGHYDLSNLQDYTVLCCHRRGKEE